MSTKRAVKPPPKAPPAPKLSREEIEQRVAKTIERTLARNIPGLTVPDLELKLDLEVGQTPKELVYTRDTLRLYHYKPVLDEIYRVPLMLVMSPVARGYILDLAPGQSLVEYLLLQGYDVYMIDWAPPRREHGHLGLVDYVESMLDGAVDYVRQDTGESELSLVGYCMGGMLASIYTALHPQRGVKNLVCFTTPVNADGMTLYKQWVESKAFDVDRLVESLGIIPGDLINASIQALRPLQRSANQLQLLNNVDNDAFVKANLRFDRWAADQLALPGELMRDFVRDFLRGNRLVDGGFPVGDKVVDLGKIRVPFLHVAAEYDHIVPTAASRDLIGLIGSRDKQEIVIKGGHVSLVAGGNAVYRLWPQLDRWLAPRSV
ncbi:MAG: alpha/beta fold hydrolase [Gammaproteobacteria bacterium]|nr:alpha/beta fold hydrolase [Gammaproteobacteria bacterium]